MSAPTPSISQPSLSTDKRLAPAQVGRLKQFNVDACADIHCHCLPGLDDGPANWDASLELCQALVDDGVTHVVATPHQLGRYEHAHTAGDITKRVEELRKRLTGQGIPLQLLVGADVRIAAELPELLDSGGIHSIGGAKRYVLLELPHDQNLPTQPLLFELARRGCTGILTHPERNEALKRNPELILPWLEGGAVLQITSGSLIGEFGSRSQSLAWTWIRQNLVHLVASDAHDTTRRRPRLTSAIKAFTAEGLPHIVTRRLCLENPLRVIRGEPLPKLRRRLSINPASPIVPNRKHGWLTRLFRRERA